MMIVVLLLEIMSGILHHVTLYFVRIGVPRDGSGGPLKILFSSLACHKHNEGDTRRLRALSAWPPSNMLLFTNSCGPKCWTMFKVGHPVPRRPQKFNDERILYVCISFDQHCMSGFLWVLAISLNKKSIMTGMLLDKLECLSMVCKMSTFCRAVCLDTVLQTSSPRI